jgi:CRISPR/Cas system-associated endoribonuclease Cas2
MQAASGLLFPQTSDSGEAPSGSDNGEDSSGSDNVGADSGSDEESNNGNPHYRMNRSNFHCLVKQNDNLSLQDNCHASDSHNFCFCSHENTVDMPASANQKNPCCLCGNNNPDAACILKGLPHYRMNRSNFHCLVKQNDNLSLQDNCHASDKTLQDQITWEPIQDLMKNLTMETMETIISTLL